MKVEYNMLPVEHRSTQVELEISLNQMGQAGWILCNTEYGWFIFYREVLGD